VDLGRGIARVRKKKKKEGIGVRKPRTENTKCNAAPTKKQIPKDLTPCSGEEDVPTLGLPPHRDIRDEGGKRGKSTK